MIYREKDWSVKYKWDIWEQNKTKCSNRKADAEILKIKTHGIMQLLLPQASTVGWINTKWILLKSLWTLTELCTLWDILRLTGKDHSLDGYLTCFWIKTAQLIKKKKKKKPVLLEQSNSHLSYIGHNWYELMAIMIINYNKFQPTCSCCIIW